MNKVAFGSVTDGDADASTSTPSPAASIAPKVSMKLPVFWPDDTKVWFSQADAHQTHHGF